MNLLHQVLFDLYQYCREDIDEVIVVDDYSEDKDLDEYYFQGMMVKKLPVTVIKKVEHEGFLKASNVGMREASGDIVVLLSNDVRVKDNIVKQIKETLAETPKAIIGNRFIIFDTGWNRFDGIIFPYIEGWLIACHKMYWEELGGFDEQFAPNDYEDIDFSTNARRFGFTLIGLKNEKVFHLGAQSLGYNPERESITNQNREKFRKKWLG